MRRITFQHIAYGLLTFLFWEIAPVLAQSQVSTGDNSPNINAPNGIIAPNSTILQAPGNTGSIVIAIHSTINSPVLPSNPTPTLEAIVRDLNKHNDALSSEISKLIKKGDFNKIQEKINREIRRLSTLPENLAFYSYIQGSLYLVQQKYLLAERSLNLAVALAPSNCKYRGLFATTLISLDRYAEANRIAGENVGEANTCLQSKDILERSRILLAQTYIAIENQDEPATIRLIRAFETSLRPPSLYPYLYN